MLFDFFDHDFFFNIFDNIDDDNKTYLESRIAEEGDFIFLASGGHGFKMLEDCELFEVKQGPYCGDMDKSRF